MTIVEPTTLRPFNWDSITLNDDLGRIEGELSADFVLAHAFAVEDFSDEYFQPGGKQIAHPLLLAGDVGRMFILGYDCGPGYRAGFHAKNTVKMHAPIEVGRRIIATARHVDKYQKRGRNYRVLQGEVVGENGQLLFELEAVETIGFAPDSSERGGSTDRAASARRKISTVVDPETVRAHPGDPRPSIGSLLPEVTKAVSFQQSVVFSGFPFMWARDAPGPIRRGIHTDIDLASAAGFQAPVVQGLISANHISEICARQFGAAWATSGELQTTFLKPVLIDENLTSRVRVREHEREPDGAETIVLDAWTEDSNGNVVTVGVGRVGVK